MDYAPIALQATDVLVDKHFHKIPNAAFRTETYKPFKASRRRRREEREMRDSQDQDQNQYQGREDSRDQGEYRDRGGQRRQEDPYNDPEIEEASYGSEPDYTSQQKDRNMRDRGWDSRGERSRDSRDIPRHSGAGTGAGYGYGYPYEESHRSSSPSQLPYSQQPPRVRPEYLPKSEASPEPRSTSQYPHYFSPPPIAPFPELDRNARDYDSDERYERESERARRPKYIQRRSSYDDIHDQRKSRPSNTDQRLATRDRNRRPRSDHGNGSNASHVGGMRDRADRYGLKDEVKGLFTDSPKGLAGGAIGALVGGWATEKFQEAQTGKDRKDMGDRAKVYTLLGAAAGGLVVNAVVDKWQDGKEETKEKQRKWDEKYPDGKKDSKCERADRDGDGRSERGRRDSVRSRDTSRRERDGDSSWERNKAYDDKARRSDGSGYDGANDGYYQGDY